MTTMTSMLTRTCPPIMMNLAFVADDPPTFQNHGFGLEPVCTSKAQNSLTIMTMRVTTMANVFKRQRRCGRRAIVPERAGTNLLPESATGICYRSLLPESATGTCYRNLLPEPATGTCYRNLLLKPATGTCYRKQVLRPATGSIKIK